MSQLPSDVPVQLAVKPLEQLLPVPVVERLRSLLPGRAAERPRQPSDPLPGLQPACRPTESAPARTAMSIWPAAAWARLRGSPAAYAELPPVRPSHTRLLYPATGCRRVHPCAVWRPVSAGTTP